MKKVCFIILLLICSAIVLSCEDFGLPYFESSSTIIQYTGYVMKYSETHEQAEWVAYQLADDEVESEEYERTDNFREDPQISKHPI